MPPSSCSAELGYGDTGLAEILQRAEVTKGAFYYHFDTKEAVASAIIEESFQKVRDAADTVIESSSPALENVIRATFVVASVMESDRSVQVGKQLAQSLTQVSDRGPKAFEEWTTRFVGQVRGGGHAGRLRQPRADEVGETVWVTVLGSHLLSDAVGDDVYARLARSWRVLLGGIVPQELAAVLPGLRCPHVPDVRPCAAPGTMRKRDGRIELVDERDLLSDLPALVRRQRR